MVAALPVLLWLNSKVSFMVKFVRDQRFISTCAQNGPCLLSSQAQVKTKLKFPLSPDLLFAAPLFKRQISFPPLLETSTDLETSHSAWEDGLPCRKESLRTKPRDALHHGHQQGGWCEMVSCWCAATASCHSLGFLGFYIILLTPA